MERRDQLFLIDGCALAWRNYHAPMAELSVECCVCAPRDRAARARGMTAAAQMPCSVCDGTGREPTTATWLTVKQILSIAMSERPAYLAVVFDGPKSILKRQRIWSRYKADRKTPAFSIRRQIDRICEIVTLLGYKVIRAGEFEADDALASLATQFADKAEPVIVTGDKDLRQLCVDPRILVRDLKTKEYFHQANAGDKWGIKTHQIVDYLILVGDACDGIPGVGGIGPKTACDLLKRFSRIGNIVVSANVGALRPGIGKKLITAASSRWLDTARRLIELDKTLDLGVSLDDLECGLPDFDAARPIMKQLRFKEWA